MSRCPPACARARTWCQWWRPPHRREIDRSLLLAVLTLSEADLDHIIDQL